MCAAPILVWDIDGTLLTAAGAGERALVAALKEVFEVTPCGAGARVPLVGQTDRFITGNLLTAYGIEDTLENRERLWSTYVVRLERLLVSEARGCVLPGVERALGVAREGGCRQGLLTGNLARAAALKLRHWGLAEWFEFGIYGDHEPERRTLGVRLMEHLRENGGEPDPRRIVVIGDTPFDAAVAHEIGARSVLVGTGVVPMDELICAKADLVLPNLEDAEPLMEFVIGPARVG